MPTGALLLPKLLVPMQPSTTRLTARWRCGCLRRRWTAGSSARSSTQTTRMWSTCPVISCHTMWWDFHWCLLSAYCLFSYVLLKFSSFFKKYFPLASCSRLGWDGQGSRHSDICGAAPVYCKSVRHHQGPHKERCCWDVSHQGMIW